MPDAPPRWYEAFFERDWLDIAASIPEETNGCLVRLSIDTSRLIVVARKPL